MNKGWGRNKTDFDVQFGNAVMFAREEEPLYQECLEGRKKVLGPDHPDTLITMYNYAFFLKKKGDLANAETQARQSLEGYFSLGLTSDVKDGVEQLTGILRAQGKDEEAAAVEQTYHN